SPLKEFVVQTPSFQRVSLNVDIMWLGASWLHRRLVPIHVQSGSMTGTNVPNRAGELIVDGQEQAPANSISAHRGRCSTRLGRSRGWARADQGRELADASRVRMGEPGLAALDPILH